MVARRPEAQDLAQRGDGAIAEGRRRLREDGWCVVPGVLSPESVAQALERLWAAAAESERRGLATYMPALDPNASNVRVFNLLDIDPLFRDLIRHPLAVDLVRSLLGQEFLISNFTANIARPGSKSMPVHSDQAIVMPAPWAHPWALNIIWALTDVRAENGATLFLPGSHRFTDRSQVPADPLPLMQPFEAPAGSIIAMEGRMWHTSGANVTADEDRALLFGYYTAPFLRPQVNHNVTLSAETQASLDPQMRHWLGLDAEANVGLAPEVFAGDGGTRQPVRVS
ncbi:MAG TPA: phytanoyl-CoA dioxygenase family protein [Caulobacteraceae bacterium]|nr:phytanoyl-CoA dioxygenase family protein [Caulobacteraceae bacterium]